MINNKQNIIASDIIGMSDSLTREWRDMYNYRMTLEYDGGRYAGWQRMGRDDNSNTVSAKITEVLKKMTGSDVEIFCGSRTETGVHAYGQVANFKLDREYRAREIQNYLNRYLPQDIAVLELEETQERFHSQLNAKSRTYVYRVDTKNIANVFERRYMYHTFHKPDVDAMNKAAQYFLGEHDYKVFSTVKKNKSTVRNVESVDIYDDGDTLEITIKADDFLHNMARLMIGILLDIGSGERRPEDVKKLLDGAKGVEISKPAESYGLYLLEVEY